MASKLVDAVGRPHRNGIEGLILGCTELPVILTRSEFGIPFSILPRYTLKQCIDTAKANLRKS